MIERHRINILMARKTAGEATVAELEELDQLLMQYPELQYTYTIIEEIQSVEIPGGFTATEEEAARERGLDKMTQFLQEDHTAVVRRLFPWKTAGGIAAGLALLIAGYSLLRLPAKNAFRNEVVTKTGSKTTLVLPDGTSVALNACSRLQYDAKRFLSGDREVVLTGEAFFDVKHDPSHPFVIQSGNVNIKVLGTAFNVKAYTEDANVETTLISGKVEVSFPDNDNTKARRVVVLQPDQKLVIPNITHIFSSKNQPVPTTGFAVVPVKASESNHTGAEDAKPETAWMNDRFEFDNASFEELSHDLERWFNVTIRFRNDRYKHEAFTGAFKKQSIDEVLQALQLTSSFHYQLDSKDNIIYIW
ncbi:FecR family protein [Chitinophaga vietnamensis]|uniref:FecR family protein n=1 Tax=Chitinophaga vietnamensis TaxID=2593957 RepID=UPI001177A602|nr:FecR domain-containing protein [Chitinophaga vietnamensis]